MDNFNNSRQSFPHYVQRFATLFRGRDDAWGRIEGGCVREKVSLEHYRRHLEGEVSLGIYPLLDDSTIWFVAIDADLANFQVALNIRNKFKEAGLNSCIEGPTKRGRYHVWLFFSEPVSARKARGIAIRVIGELGYDNIETLKELEPSNPNPHVEIFPKQDEAAEVEFGNYINLPYFGNTRTILTVDQTVDQKPVPLDYFLEHVRKNTYEKLDEAVSTFIVPEAKEEKENIPAEPETKSPEKMVGLLPCVRMFMRKGADEGNRDESLFRLAIHLKRLNFPSEIAEDLVMSVNLKCRPPLSEKEAKDKTRSAYKERGKNYKNLGCGDPLWTSYYCGEEQRNKCPIYKSQQLREVKKGNPSQADKLTDLVLVELQDQVFLFHDDLEEPYAQLKINDHHEIFRCLSRQFKRWLSQKFYEKEEKIPNTEALKSALNVIEGKACFDGPCIPLHVRSAWHEGALWYDLGDWRAVEITAEGWEVVDDPPILFYHFSHQLPQVEPERGGSLEEFDRFVNLPLPADRVLIHTYIVTALIPSIPRPILVLYGDQGSAKSFLFRVLKRLIDPSVLETTSPPDNLREFVQLASHHLVLYLDNLSGLPDWLSDAFSRLSTGEGLSKRMLYTDDDDVVYALKRLGGINGINLVATKPDILDRCLIFGLQRIPKKQRQTEEEILPKFEEARPRILGAIFDAVAGSMRELPKVNPTYISRMADFCHWGCATAQALGYRDEVFLKAYQKNLNDQNESALESSPVATVVRRFMQGKESWEGNATELLKLLGDIAPSTGVDTNSRLWPKDVRWLGRRLAEVRPNLAQDGIITQLDKRTAGERYINLRKISENDATHATHATTDGNLHLGESGINSGNKSYDAQDLATQDRTESGNSDNNGIKFPQSPHIIQQENEGEEEGWIDL
jgi:hypothetical protein